MALAWLAAAWCSGPMGMEVLAREGAAGEQRNTGEEWKKREVQARDLHHFVEAGGDEWEGWFELRVVERAVGRGRVLLETEGPGVVTAIEAPRRAGLVQVFVDGGSRAVLTFEADEARWQGSAWASVDEERLLLTAPIPFAESVRVVAEHETWSRVAYRDYGRGGRVRSTTKAEIERLVSTRAEVGEGEMRSFAGMLVPSRHESALLDLPDGSHRVREMSLALPSGVDAEVLESIEVVVVCDGVETIRVPAAVLMESAREDAEGLVLSCRRAFAYGAGCQVGLVNTGRRAIEGRLEVMVEASEWSDDAPMLYGVCGAFARKGTGEFREVLRVEGPGMLLGAWAGDVEGWRGAHVEIDGGRAFCRAIPVSGWGRLGNVKAGGAGRRAAPPHQCEGQPFTLEASLRVHDGEAVGTGGRFAAVFYAPWGARMEMEGVEESGVTSRSADTRRD